MNKQQLKDIFSDECFFERLKSAANKKEAQKLLLEKGADISVDEFIEFLLRHNGKRILSDEEMETVCFDERFWQDIAVRYLEVNKQIIDTYGLEKFLNSDDFAAYGN